MRRFIKMLAAIWIIALSMTNFVGCSDDKNDDYDRDSGCNNHGRRDSLSGQLLILQAYGSSGDAAGASHSFVEIYNNSDSPINLSGITLFHADGIRGLPAREAGVDDNWRAIPLSGTIPAKTSFLILGARENTTGRLSINDNSGDINDPNFSLSNRAFKVALIRGTTPLTVQNPFTMDGNGSQIAVGFIDLLGTANNIDHATNPDNIFGYKGTPTRNSASEAVRRITLDGTDNNAADFESIRYAHGGVDDDELEHFRPKNREFGAWNPLTGGLIGYRGRAEGTLPVIFIDAYGAEIHGSATGIWTNMTFSLNDPNNPQNNIATIRNQEIRGRGNTTWGYPKQPFRIRFRNDTSMFGLAARRNWILLAEFQDPTFLTNAATLYLGREVFNLPYTNTHKHVHLYLDGEYWGVYLLTEHRQADPNGIGAPGRANVDFNNGGWFVQLDVGTDEPWFKTDNFNLPVNISAPSFSDNIDDPRYRFIIDDWAEFTDLLACQTFPENGWRDLVDINSLVDFIMVNEIVQNFEPNHPKSTFFYRRSRNDKISAGMLWDFDWGFGYVEGGGHIYFAGHRYIYFHQHSANAFWGRFFEDPVFVARYRARFTEKLTEILAVSDFIKSQGLAIRAGVKEDSKRWIMECGSGYWEGYDPDHARQVELMADWWIRRVNYLNARI
ncbi:MAG: CotH kinase family protein [Chitinivibrionia bacterium]|nr:CotH kinase family protein [Chitinivibrionia bacterium]